MSVGSMVTANFSLALEGELNAGSGMDTSIADSQFEDDATAGIFIYAVGHSSGRGGEIWKQEGASITKVGDWVVPNDAGAEYHVKVDNLVGTTPTGWPGTSYTDMSSGTGNLVSFELSRTFIGDGPGTTSCTFDMTLSRDGSTPAPDTNAGPIGWSLDAEVTN